MPEAELEIDEPLVRSLLEDQARDLAGLPLREVAYGWDNVIYRLGDDLTVRLPRRAVAAVLIEHEQRWLPELAPALPVPIPAPVVAGVPALGYPWHWSVTPWFDGDSALRAPPSDAGAAAVALGRFVRALHRTAPEDAPHNPVRGVPLAQRRPLFDDAVARAGRAGLVDEAHVRALWAELEATPPWPGAPVWLHGDLHPGNIVVAHGRVAAVIDFGDINAGDPATDLAVAWMLFDGSARTRFRAEAGAPDEDTWSRARAWALAIGLACMTNSDDNPPFLALGRRTVAAALR